MSSGCSSAVLCLPALDMLWQDLGADPAFALAGQFGDVDHRRRADHLLQVEFFERLRLPISAAFGRPESGGGMKWAGASMWVPQCSSIVRTAV